MYIQLEISHVIDYLSHILYIFHKYVLVVVK